MVIKIPNERKWSITNSGDVFGSLFSCYNVHFDEEGYASIAPKTVSLYSNVVADGGDADFGDVVAIVNFDNGYYIVTDDGVFSLESNLDFSEIASSPSTAENSDAVVWQGRLYVSSTTNLSYYTGSAWTNSLKATTSGKPHPMAVMGNFSGGHLAIAAGGNTVLRLDTSHNTVVTMTINADYEIQCLKYYQNNLYIGTRSINGSEAKVFVWNGSGTSPQAEYSVAANWVYALEEYMSSVVAATSEGQILRFTGGGFDTLANFPVYHSPYRWEQGSGFTGKIQRRGMIANGDLLYININGTVSRTMSVGTDTFTEAFHLPNQPSGVWCFDPKVGLYCRHLHTTDSIATIVPSSVSDSVLTLPSAIRATTGEPIYIQNDSANLTGVDDDTTYYVIRLTSTTIQLAVTSADALAGNAITLGGTVTDVSVKVVKYEQYGERWGNHDVGAICFAELDGINPRIFPEMFNTTILWGFGSSATERHLNSLSTASNIGNIITNKIWSSEVLDSFQKMFLKYSGLYLESEKIVIKKRTKNIFGLPTQVVEGAFSTASILGSDAPYLSQVESGHNINILKGNGAGQSVTIEEVDDSEFILTETLPNVASPDVVQFTVDNFELVEEISDDETFSEISLGDESSWLQMMLELRGRHVKIEELQLVQTINQPAE